MKTYSYDEMKIRIKNLKKEKGFTNETLATSSGVATGTLNKLLGSETKEPSLNTILKIANVLDVKAEYLIFGDSCDKQTFDVGESRSDIKSLINLVATETADDVSEIIDLVSGYQKLNPQGQEYIRTQFRYALSDPLYKKDLVVQAAQ